MYGCIYVFVLSYTSTHVCFVIAFSFGKETNKKVENPNDFKNSTQQNQSNDKQIRNDKAEMWFVAILRATAMPLYSVTEEEGPMCLLLIT